MRYAAPHVAGGEHAVRALRMRPGARHHGVRVCELWLRAVLALHDGRPESPGSFPLRGMQAPTAVLLRVAVVVVAVLRLAAVVRWSPTPLP